MQLGLRGVTIIVGLVWYSKGYSRITRTFYANSETVTTIDRFTVLTHPPMLLFGFSPVHAGRKKPTDGQIMLRELVRFFIDVKIHDHATYYVDSLWDYAAVLKVIPG